jgi:hypothetical protein
MGYFGRGVGAADAGHRGVAASQNRQWSTCQIVVPLLFPSTDPVFPFQAAALRKALIILRKYQRIQTKKDDYHRMVRRLKDQIASGDSVNASKTEEFRMQNSDFENQVQGLRRYSYLSLSVSLFIG